MLDKSKDQKKLQFHKNFQITPPYIVSLFQKFEVPWKHSGYLFFCYEINTIPGKKSSWKCWWKRHKSVFFVNESDNRCHISKNTVYYATYEAFQGCTYVAKRCFRTLTAGGFGFILCSKVGMFNDSIILKVVVATQPHQLAVGEKIILIHFMLIKCDLQPLQH